MANQLIVLAVFVLLGYLLGISLKIKKGIIPALLLAVLLLMEYFINDIQLLALMGIGVNLLTILKGLLAGLIFRSMLK